MSDKGICGDCGKESFSRIKLKVYKGYYIASEWLNDALHPGRQKVDRERIRSLAIRLSNAYSEQRIMSQHVEYLEEAVKKDVMSATAMLARDISVSVKEGLVPYYGMGSCVGDDGGLEPVEACHIALERRSVVARMDILDCHKLKRIKVGSKKGLAMYAICVADGLADVLTEFVLKELLEDLTDE